MTEKEFLKNHNIDNDAYLKTGISWESLMDTKSDYDSKHKELLVHTSTVMNLVSTCEKVHSTRMRVKDSWHLLDKIIRKRIDNDRRIITKENYMTEITDLMGVRVLHLLKADWIDIHQFIISKWHLFEEKPIAYVRAGDVTELYEEKGCSVKCHPFGYRSVHYVVKLQIDKQTELPCEIQVRTIFEEGWSEIDHKFRYPYVIGNEVLNRGLELLNRQAGSADDIGTFIQYLIKILDEDKTHKDEMSLIIKRLQAEVEEIKGKTEKQKGISKELASLQQKIDKQLSIPDSASITIRNSGMVGIGTNAYFKQFESKVCQLCGKTILPIGLGGTGEICDTCRLTQQTCKKCGKSLPFYQYSADGLCDVCRASGQ